jgi:aldose sugar dehydrogenase
MKKSVWLALTLCLAAATAMTGAQQEPAGGRQGAAGRAGGAAGGRGQQAPPAIPAAESRVATNCAAPPCQPWPAPPLGDGPFLLQSAVPAHRDLRVVVMARLRQPWSMAFLPDDAILVTERGGGTQLVDGTRVPVTGQLRIIRNGVLDPNPVAGLPPVYSGGLQGLMDVVLHPRFNENRWLYLSYHKPVPDPRAPPPAATNAAAVNQAPPPAPRMAGATTLIRATWNGSALTDVTEIFFDPEAVRTEASRIGFARDGMVHMTISASGTGADVMRSADPNDHAGKTIRIRDDGTIPQDNPFVGKPGYKPAIYTLGHRNGHSMQLNPETGEFWVTEQGPNGGDEINVLVAGADYGWPFVSHGRNYMGSRISPTPWKEGAEPPAVVWVPSIAVTGGTFYTGDVFTGWKRNFFVGGLREGEVAPSGQLQRLEFNERWEEIRREPLLRELKQRIRDVRQGPDGLLYVLTAETNGALLRIEPQ